MIFKTISSHKKNMHLTILFLLCTTFAHAQSDSIAVVRDTLPYEQYFTGVARKTAKINISEGDTLAFEKVGDVLDFLPADSTMRQMGIKDKTRRLPEEDYNIIIDTAYLFSIELEDDGDLHLLIGDIIDSIKTNLMTVEVSGLPDRRNPSFETLLDVRKTLYDEYPKCFSGKRVRPTKKFRKITIQGSLFFDNRHPATGKAHRPKTAFELHPITYIEFLE
jgi:hypothetical protein